MIVDRLKNPPLVEAIFEMKWALQPSLTGSAIDPHYKFLLGRLFDRVSPQYPAHEQLPAAMLPDDAVGQIVQHRFRATANGWPLIQIGPGILTVNDTYNYAWVDFKSRIATAVGSLFDAHPHPSDLRAESVLLRYIDVIEFDYSNEDILAFLKEKMGVRFELPASLFDDTGVQSLPGLINLQTAYRCVRPPGLASIRFTSGMNNGRRALIWETVVQSAEKDVPSLPEHLADWTNSAHEVTHSWFTRLVEGELERIFNG